ncbi:anaphase-promoting complex subunit 2-like [Ptychodera flava]|uniref:anaphase-promoting complex subunit 2-like n=1 Tax=Ptychodera flava TaxID=63121 RepID=UPI00396A2D41
MAVSVERDLDSAWQVLTSTFSAQSEKRGSSPPECKPALKTLQRHGMGYIIEDWFTETLQQDLQRRIAANFWKNFPEDPLPDGEPHANSFVSAINELHRNSSPYMKCVEWLEELKDLTQSEARPRLYSLTERVQTLFKAVLFSIIPTNFYEKVSDFYSKAFRAFHQLHKDEESEDEDDNDDDEGPRCPGCSKDSEQCDCAKVLSDFHQVNQELYELGLLERVSAVAVTSIIHSKIEHHIQHTCKGEFESSCLQSLEKWLHSKVVGWLNLVFRGESNDRTLSAGTEASLVQWKDRLQYFLYQTYANLRIEELFNVIVEYPDSMPALEDLKCCLEKTDQRQQLVMSLKTALETRLLHPGANTADILTQYISSIRALRVLDPAGVILELVCEPVRKYLRTRDDTVRCIVSSLTDDSSSDLADELSKGEPLLMDENYYSDEESGDPETWQPDPIDADPAKTSKSRRSSDIISMLVNIYGSRELFVNEYRTLLADRILSSFNYDTAREIRYLELLKLRFGESQLHYCEVMLKDVADSKRINTHIRELDDKKQKDEKTDCLDLNSMILSAQFWPSFREEKLELPQSIKDAMEKYTKEYETLKGMRTLNWKPHLGLVSLEVELKDRKLSLSVSPIHATIIMHFQEKDTWTIEELSNVMQVPSTALRRKIAYWQSQGVVKEQAPDTFVLIEERPGGRGNHEVMMIDSDEETESAMASAQDQREEELQVFWSYIVGMLTNLESLPLERIYSMLKMFAMQGPSAVECSEEELRHFLDCKVKEQKLIFSGGVYRLPKGTS